MGTNQDVGLLEQLTNGSWTPTAAPLPSNTGTGGAGLNGVSCTFDGICTAVGSYNNAVNGGLPLIDTVDGATVTATEGPQPADTATGSGSAGTLQRGLVPVRHGLRRRRLLPQQHELGHGRGPHADADRRHVERADDRPARRRRDRLERQLHPLLRELHGAWHLRDRGELRRHRGYGVRPRRVVRAARGLLVGGLRRRRLQLRPQRALPRLHGRPASQRPDGGHGGDARWRGLLGGGVRRRGVQLRQRRLLRLDGQPAPQCPHCRHGRHPGRRRLLARGLRRRRLQLRGRAVVRLGGIDCTSTSPSSAWP